MVLYCSILCLCYMVLYCAMLSCAVLYGAILCHAVLCCAIWCYTVPCCPVLCYMVLYCAMLSCAVLYGAILCHTMYGGVLCWQYRATIFITCLQSESFDSFVPHCSLLFPPRDSKSCNNPIKQMPYLQSHFTFQTHKKLTVSALQGVGLEIWAWKERGSGWCIFRFTVSPHSVCIIQVQVTPTHPNCSIPWIWHSSWWSTSGGRAFLWLWCNVEMLKREKSTARGEERGGRGSVWLRCNVGVLKREKSTARGEERGGRGSVWLRCNVGVLKREKSTARGEERGGGVHSDYSVMPGCSRGRDPMWGGKRGGEGFTLTTV